VFVMMVVVLADTADMMMVADLWQTNGLFEAGQTLPVLA